MNLKLYLLKEKLTSFEKPLKAAILVVIILLAVLKRGTYINDQSKDIYAYEKAIGDLIAGKNPYVWTVESFSNPDDPSNHGFAYFPGLLYIFAPFYILHLQTGFPHYVLWKIPVLLADIGVGLLLFQIFKKKGILPLTTALLIWFFNPYTVFRTGYAYADPLAIFFMFLSLTLLEKDEVLAGASYALSIAIKTFPFVIFPVVILKSKNKIAFLLSGVMVGILISLPFLKSPQDFMTYLNGTLFVHQNRFIQGRPFLFYISYFYKIELFQIIPFGVYSLVASFSGWVLATIAYLSKKISNKYILSLIPFLTFYLFTPVFNRTYFMWFIPIYVTSMFDIFEKKRRILFYLSQILFFSFASWYLIQWVDGFHIWHP